jgi:hypothetical protein
MNILNLTQHSASADQKAANVVEPSNHAEVKRLLTFDEMPTPEQVSERADLLAQLADKEFCEFVMIGGAPYLMAPLERQLKRRGMIPLYAFSLRESVERTLADGSVVKDSVFRHVGFLEATGNCM